MPPELCKQLNYAALAQLINSQAKAECPASLPIVIPGLLDSATCKQVSAIQPGTAATGYPLPLKRLCWELNSGGFLKRLEKLTQLQPLIPDPHLDNAGILEAKQALDKPAFPDKQQTTKLSRSCSLIISLSQPLAIKYANKNSTATMLMTINPGDCLVIDQQPEALEHDLASQQVRYLLLHFYTPNP